MYHLVRQEQKLSSPSYTSSEVWNRKWNRGGPQGNVQHHIESELKSWGAEDIWDSSPQVIQLGTCLSYFLPSFCSVRTAQGRRIQICYQNRNALKEQTILCWWREHPTPTLGDLNRYLGGSPLFSSERRLTCFQSRAFISISWCSQKILTSYDISRTMGDWIPCSDRGCIEREARGSIEERFRLGCWSIMRLYRSLSHAWQIFDFPQPRQAPRPILSHERTQKISRTNIWNVW